MKSRIILCESCTRARGIVGVWPEIAIRIVSGSCEDCGHICTWSEPLRTFQVPDLPPPEPTEPDLKGAA